MMSQTDSKMRSYDRPHASGIWSCGSNSVTRLVCQALFSLRRLPGPPRPAFDCLSFFFFFLILIFSLTLSLECRCGFSVKGFLWGFACLFLFPYGPVKEMARQVKVLAAKFSSWDPHAGRRDVTLKIWPLSSRALWHAQGAHLFTRALSLLSLPFSQTLTQTVKQ